MKTVEELENKINDFETTLSGLKNELQELKKKKNSFEPTPKGWKPQEGEVYYIANRVLKADFYRFINDEIDNGVIKYNRIFQTKKECRLYCDIQKAFRDASREFVRDKANCYLWCDSEDNIETGSATMSINAMLYFDSKETIQNLIDKFGEENVKRYYLGVY